MQQKNVSTSSSQIEFQFFFPQSSQNIFLLSFFPYIPEGVPLLCFDLIFQPLEYFDCGQHRDQYVMVDKYK